MVRIAISGLGRMGARHIEAVQRLGHSLFWLHDPSDAPFALTPELCPLHRKTMGETCDLLIIASAADTHYPLAVQAIKQGFKRILIEKPVTQSHAQAVKLQRLALQNNVRVIVNHGRRYDENYKHLATMGELRSISLRFGGGGLGCVGTHWIDLCSMLFGALPLSVNALLTPALPNPRGARFQDAGGNVQLLYPHNKRATLEIGDDIGFIGGADFMFSHFQISWRRESEPWQRFSRSLEDLSKPLSHYGLPLETSLLPIVPPDVVTYAMRAIEDALSDADAQSSLLTAIQTMEIFAAAHASHNAQKRITLPLTLKQSRRIFPIP